MGIVCLVIGHKALNVGVRRGIVQTVRDSRGIPILDIVLCERCRGLYWTAIPATAIGSPKTPESS